MESVLISWFLAAKEAKELTKDRAEVRKWANGAYDAMVQTVSALRDISASEADEWLAEEIQERLASQG